MGKTPTGTKAVAKTESFELGSDRKYRCAMMYSSLSRNAEGTGEGTTFFVIGVGTSFTTSSTGLDISLTGHASK